MNKTFYTVKDGKIDRIQTGESPAGNADWKEAPANWGGAHGDKLEWFDGAMKRVTDAELVKQGKRVDNTGKVFNTEDQTSRIIYCLDEALAKNETKLPPLADEPYQKFDAKTKAWEIDIEKKELAEQERELSEIQAQIAEAEKDIIAPMRAIISNRATPEDTQKYNELDALIESLTPALQIKQSEITLKKSA